MAEIPYMSFEEFQETDFATKIDIVKKDKFGFRDLYEANYKNIWYACFIANSKDNKLKYSSENPVEALTLFAVKEDKEGFRSLKKTIKRFAEANNRI